MVFPADSALISSLITSSLSSEGNPLRGTAVLISQLSSAPYLGTMEIFDLHYFPWEPKDLKKHSICLPHHLYSTGIREGYNIPSPQNSDLETYVGLLLPLLFQGSPFEEEARRWYQKSTLI